MLPLPTRFSGAVVVEVYFPVFGGMSTSDCASLIGPER
jgi:hypothetical protein